jgi:hypothetical protein
MGRSLVAVLSGAVAVLVLASSVVLAQEMVGSLVSPPETVLEAEAAGRVEVRFIPNDSRSGQVILANREDQPLTLRLPAAFTGVPVAAQFGVGGVGMQNGGMGGAGLQPAQQAQPVGGGGMGMAGGGFPGCWVAREVYGVHDPRWLAFREWMLWRAPAWLQTFYGTHGEAAATWLSSRPAARAGLRLLMDFAIDDSVASSAACQMRVASSINPAAPFTIPAGKSLVLRVPLVCLAYGLPEPNARMPYRLQPLAAVSEDPRLAVLLGGLASGHLTQPVAQAAAWNVASGRSWEQLGAEVVKGVGGFPDQPVFSAAELVAARRAVEIATRVTSSADESGSVPGVRSSSER